MLDKDELLAMKNRQIAARKMIHDLCQPRGTAEAREWIMSIPAQPERDPDLVIGMALSDTSRLLASVELLLPIYHMAKQAYSVDAIAEWFDMEGDGLKSLLETFETWLA